MSAATSNLFNYARPLPAPFDTLSNKRVKVSSMYGDKTESTLCCSVVKAVLALCNCMNGTGEGAVGQIDTNKSVAEYKSSESPDAYHLVVFDAASGSVLASVYDKNAETTAQYVVHQSQRDGAAIFLALMPLLLSDTEFDETFQDYYDQFIAGYPDMEKATRSMAILCDNAYRRIKDDTCPAHINITVDKSGNLMRVSLGQLDSGFFTPTSVTAGEFTIFAKTGPAVIKKASTVIEHSDFVGKYLLTPGRKLSPVEQSLSDSMLTVDFGDGRVAEYDKSDLELLDLAYASTIHKSQGSEYKSVIINLQCAHAVMLVRPLIYTAITRAKERVIIVGERRALCIAIKRIDTERRGTKLAARIRSLVAACDMRGLPD